MNRSTEDETTGEAPLRRPGQWPVPRTELPEPESDPVRRGTAEAARFHITLGSIRAALEEQPTPGTVRSAGRRWLAAVTQLIDEVAQDVHDRNKEGAA
ncbi:hypothetical protein PV392_08290 [Streptomyces sp. ME03-5709C]|nr:hypothetical protein [Streptomyces sp. ME03-5709C]